MQFNLFVVNDYCHRVFGINRSFLKLHQHFVNYNQESIKGREIAREQAFNRAFFLPKQRACSQARTEKASLIHTLFHR